MINTMNRKHNPRLMSNARSLRKNMTKEERHLWYDFLKPHPITFKRQQIIGHYIADFYCASANLVIELDGSQHFTLENEAKEASRTADLETYGLTVLRFSNLEIQHNFCGVCQTIDQVLTERLNRSPYGSRP